MRQTILITGSSSGFGKLTAKLFHEKGWNVIATMRSPEKENELNQLDNVLVTRLDVTDKKSVGKAIKRGIEEFGVIDVLVNNAGYGGHAFLEQFTEEQIYQMFETNVFGVIRVSQAVLPHMREQKSGTIINVTSMAGYVGLSLTSTYCASKFAVEGLTEAMALEYKPLGIKVKAVAPGAFGTNFTAATDDNIENGDDELKPRAEKMATHFATLAEQMQHQGGKMADPQEVAEKIYTCVTMETDIHNVVGADAEMLMGMMNSMPRQAFINQVEEMLIPKED